MIQLQKKVKSGSLDLNKDDPFELFVAATTIRYCYYGETHKVLGNTFGMLILQVCWYFMFCNKFFLEMAKPGKLFFVKN